MIVLEVINNWPAETFIERHCQSLNSISAPVIVVSRLKSLDYAQQSSVDGSNAKPKQVIPNFDHLNTIEKIISLKYLAKISEFNLLPRNLVQLGFFKSLKPDLIHFHDANLAVNMSWIAQKLGIPYTLSLRGSDVQVAPLLSQDYRSKLRITLLCASGVHSVSDALWKKTVKDFVLQDDSVFHRTIYTIAPLSNQKKSFHEIKQGEIYQFISVGRLHWTKGYLNLLLAFRSFLDHGVNAKLTIIGDGLARDELIYWTHMLNLGASINLPGKLPYSQFSKMITDLDAFIQSSIAEGFSNAVAEAMALGIPVFATDVGGTKEIIKDGENGILLDSIKPEKWCEKLLLVQDQQLMQSLGNAAWTTANSIFSAKKHATEFVTFYENVLNG